MKISRLLSAALLAALLSANILPAQDNEVAALRAKAEKGNAIAQYNLGLAYAEGRGVPADPIEAYAWLSLAMENGARGQALNFLITTLDNSTLAAARERLAEHRAARNLKPAPAAEPTMPVTSPTAHAATKPAAAAATTVASKSSLSSEVAQAWQEIEFLKTELARAKENSATADQLRHERDALTAKLIDLSAESTTLRAEHERLQTLMSQTELGISEQSRLAQEKIQTAELRADGFNRDLNDAKFELERAKATLSALQQAPKPIADNSAVEQSARELQTARADLEAAHQTEQQLNARLNKTEAAKSSLEQILNTAQIAALESGKQVDALKAQLTAQAEKLKPAAPAYPDLSARVNDLQQQIAASEAQRRAALAAKPAAPAYPDLSTRVRELETQLVAAAKAKPAAPAYPDLSARVNDLQQQIAASEAQRRAALAAKPAAPTYPDLSARVRELETQLAAAAAMPAAPAYPDLSAQVYDLQQQIAAKPAAPAYPDLSARVRELETQLTATAAKPAAAAYPDLSAQVKNLQAQLTAATKPAAPAYLDLSERVRALEASLAEAQAALHSEQTKAAAKAKPAAPAYPDMSNRVRTLEASLAEAQAAVQREQVKATASEAQHRTALAAKPAARTYPDLSGRVLELETQLAAATAKSAAPAYPDLSDHVRTLEASLVAAQATTAAMPVVAAAPAPATESSDLAKELAETKEKLELSLRGYTLLQNERDELAARAAQLNASISTGRDSLSSRLAMAESKAELAQDEVGRAAQSLAALQRSTSQASNDYVAQQQLLQQMRGAMNVLAQENYQLKAAFARDPNAPRNTLVTPVPVTTTDTPVAVRTHTVVAGDSLSKISLRYYGTANRWNEVMQANRGMVSTTGVVRIGTKLRIP